MRSYFLLFICLIFTTLAFAQQSNSDLRMVSKYASENPEMRDILRFEGIEYLKIKFIGQALKSKSYHLTVKEIWDGKVRRDTTIINSAELPFEQFQTVNDTVFAFKVISKLTDKQKLKMTFKFAQFAVTREFDAIESDDYSLRNVAKESKLAIGYDKKFYLLAYILPYEKENGSKSWCNVGTSGGDIENWGNKFGIKHYLLFEMKFE